MCRYGHICGYIYADVDADVIAGVYAGVYAGIVELKSELVMSCLVSVDLTCYTATPVTQLHHQGLFPPGHASHIYMNCPSRNLVVNSAEQSRNKVIVWDATNNTIITVRIKIIILFNQDNCLY